VCFQNSTVYEIDSTGMSAATIPIRKRMDIRLPSKETNGGTSSGRKTLRLEPALGCTNVPFDRERMGPCGIYWFLINMFQIELNHLI
jgi:hypothetical protein